MIDLLVATTNAGKFAEVQAFLKNYPLRILSLEGIAGPPQVVENGRTFEENALKKARTLAQFSGLITLADDSGLEVDALDGAPGIYSARYAGAESNDKRNNEKLLRELQQVPEVKRTARFVCALALVVPEPNRSRQWTVRKSCEGRIAFGFKGIHGFGYDPLFFYPPLGKTFGELERDIKASVSHRGKALRIFADKLPSLLELTAKP